MEKNWMEKDFRVRYTAWPPFTFDIPDGNKTRLDGALRDVLDALSYALKYEFPVEAQEDHVYGSLQPDGNFSGMFGVIQRKEVDIVGPFVATEQRTQVVDFTNCLGFSTLGIITGIASSDRNIFLYANVFTWQVWLALFVTIIGLGFATALIYKVTTEDWKADQNTLLSRYVFKYFSYLLGQDGGGESHWTLVKIWNLNSFRILLTAWLLGPVINSLFSFQGRITSTFAINKMRPVVADLDELGAKTSVIPVLTSGSVVQICFRESPAHAHLWKRMEKNYIVFAPENVEATLNKIEKGTHIMIIDYIYAVMIVSEYVKRKGRCTIQVEELKFCQNFITFGFRKDMPRKTQQRLNSGLTLVMQAKLTDRWMNRVFPNYTHCTKQPQDGTKPLGVTDIAGGFLIWGIGIAVSIPWLIVEVVTNKRERKKRKKSFTATAVVPVEDAESAQHEE